ncbi:MULTISPECIES: 23S rRNA (guanosine(2251)-2'-O)-methyltransferase RlmB [Enterococcus]|uniref:TrmH family tRNA/rRNA methyltransferase n=1 Tax=Enterococcus casseliflavus TaxID=37734 RepID=A0A6N3AMS5_ENTCA|nr:23S rRNA (guanosine(2251)-2'-O)-methyltransferase RlmB [Enterococcus casseliflavus]EPH64775.1 RNA methyltransferase, TrmH family, group 3 [Enterococcus casseliflavus 14-MB-W-14]ROY46463.1 23S rRNA (guanosine(2251)-2'-O)-methyltransferase RlmB [Enterococcus casseliflavus]
MREKPQRKRPNKKTAGRSEARQENKPDRRKEAAGEAIEDNFVFGYHAVAEALKEGRGNKLFLSEEARGEKIDRLKEMAREQAVPVKWVPKQKLDTMSDQGVHQGMILAITPYQYLTLDELLAQTKEQPLYLILDNLEDPHNFGSIMRTADASGVDGIIIPKHRAVGITPIVVKTSTGAVEHIPVARVTNLTQAVQQLKKAGFWIFGTDMSGSDYRTWNAKGAVGLIIGNEGRGMGEGLKKEVDQMLTIPMTGHVQSLNASVAAGLLMYQAFTSRNGASQ